METGDEPERSSERLVVIGNFDGVHRGHQCVLSGAVRQARQQGILPTVLTFHPHPSLVLGKTVRPPLTSLERKIELLREIDGGLEVVVHPFTKELAALSPQQFVKSVLCDELSARIVVVGENFRFGRDRGGDLTELRRLGRTLGFVARAEPLHGDAAGAFSSTRVRQALGQGDVRAAREVLGRSHRITGTVVRGDQRGRTLGFPTANLDQIEELLPAHGVYRARVCVLSPADVRAETLGTAVVNVGGRPTVGRPDTVEAHVLDYEGDLYEKKLAIDFEQRLREVQRFDSIQELTAQIGRDVRAARDALEREHLTGDEPPGQDGAPDRCSR